MTERSRGGDPEQIDLFPTQETERTKETEPTEVARLQILRAKSIGEIKKDLEAGVKPEDLFFVNSLWIEKSQKSETAGRIMQIGGKRSGDESLEQTAIREMLEETHLRPTKIDRIDQDQKYTFEHSKRGDVTNDVAYFNIRILPSDRDTQLNPEEDKIEQFHRLDLPGVGSLLGKRKDDEDEQELKVVEHLQWWREPEDGSVRIDLDQEETLSVQAELIYSMQESETQQKIDILYELLFRLKSEMGDEEYKSVYEKLQYFENNIQYSSYKEDGGSRQVYKDIISEVQKFYSSFVAQYDISGDELLDAVDFVNLKEEVYHGGQSGAKKYLRFMVTLFNSPEWTRKHFDEASMDIDISMLVGDIEDLFYKMYELLLPEDKDKIKKLEIGPVEIQNGLDIIHILQSYDDPEMDKKIEQVFVKTFKLENRSVSELSGEVNTFISGLAEKSSVLGGDKYPVHLIEQLDEIEDALVAQLLEFAITPQSGLKEEMSWRNVVEDRARKISLGGDGNLDQSKFEEAVRQGTKEMIFEARRKLVLIKLFDDAFEYYDKVILDYEENNSDEVWSGIVSSDIHKAYKVFGVGGSEAVPRDYVLELSRPQNAEMLLTETQLIKDENGETQALVSESTRIKTIQSIVRKFLIRGMEEFSEIQDVHGRAYTLQPIFEKENSRSGFMPTEYGDDHDRVDKKYKGESGSYKEYPIVKDMVDRLESQEGVRIINYRPTNFDKKVSSVGPGGGGEVRFAKFYAEYTSSDGVVSHEEIQIFTPDEMWVDSDGKKGHGGAWYKEQKEQDDDRYEIRRLSDTRGLRSFIELMWSVQIYGDLVHTMYSKEHGKDKDES
ncbi:NUDIX domain-containing protein [Candidatus Parcubacteria bacterium]|jgi:8-oxo-dGTP pyrophosphatase MutT (NUDIX family)|nr:NUDIX domain-containing protein [Candidatus Parcubacteria bacterium]